VSLATLLADAAERSPGAPAIVFEGERLDYAALAELADRAAGALHAQGVAPGDRVAIVLPNGPAFIAAFHGTLRLGAVAVPINPLSSDREIEQRVTDSGARVVVREPLAGVPLGRVVEAAGDETAVVLYTSGTTGAPKRIELSHDGLRLNATYLARDALGLRADDVVLGAAPLAHVFGMTACMNATIAAGACLAVVARFEPAAALELFARDGVTVFLGVPAMCVALLRASDESGLAPHLRIAHVGGAPLAVETAGAFAARFGAEVLEGYGMTEVGGTAVTNHAGRPVKPGSVGTAAAGTELRIDGDDPVGELLLRGPALMRGHEGWFATGDIARIDEDGYVYLVDRAKDVILRGGYTVYPREIEEVLYEHPQVREAVVVGVPDDRVGEEVVAVVVPTGPACDPAAVQAFVRERVAAYKYPRRVILVADLPRSPNGKILRREIDVEALQR
jgi:long-chain acyl-CoA synthetase